MLGKYEIRNIMCQLSIFIVVERSGEINTVNTGEPSQSVPGVVPTPEFSTTEVEDRSLMP